MTPPVEPKTAPIATPVIAIDGPGGVGKSTVAKRLAERLGYYFLSSGMIYRAMAWYLMQHGWKPELGMPEPATIERELGRLDVRVAAGGRVIVQGRDATETLRDLPVSKAASVLSTDPAVRARSNAVQREIVADIGRNRSYTGVVLEGRDIGTVVFPNAQHKFFLTADEKIRAQRHLKDVRVGQPGATLEEVRKSLQERDARDAGRAVAPLVAAADAKVVDTSRLALDEVLETILASLK